jgi:hypothetical protein
MDGNISVHEPGLDEDAIRAKMIVAMRQELVETYGEEAAEWDDDKVADEMGVCESAFFYMRDLDLTYLGGQIDPHLPPAEASTAAWVRRCELGRLHDALGREMKVMDELALYHAEKIVEVEEDHSLELTLRGPCSASPTGFHFLERQTPYMAKLACPFCGQPIFASSVQEGDRQWPMISN